MQKANWDEYSSKISTGWWFQPLVYLPLWNTWKSYDSQLNGKSFKIPWFQSPPTSLAMKPPSPSFTYGTAPRFLPWSQLRINSKRIMVNSDRPVASSGVTTLKTKGIDLQNYHKKKLRQAKFKSLFQVCIRIFSILFRGCYSSKDGKPSMIWGIMRRYLVILWDMTWDIMVATTKLILGNV